MKRVALAALLMVMLAAGVAPAAEAWGETGQVTASGPAVRTASTKSTLPPTAVVPTTPSRPTKTTQARPEDETDDALVPPADETNDALVPPADETNDALVPPADETDDALSDTNPVLQSVPIQRELLVALTPAIIRDQNPYSDIGSVERTSLGPVEGIGISFRAAAEQLGSHWLLSLIVGLVAAVMSLTIVERRVKMVPT